jgi:tRNA(fMet)-specific endonuclease VapC
VIYLLDTDTCVFALKHQRRVLAQLARRSPDEIAVAAMTEAELAFGTLNSRDPETNARHVEAFLFPLQRLPFDSVAARHHARLRYALRASPIGERDLVIASTAVAQAATVVTHNRKEFGRVPGLPVEDWSV